MRRCYSAVWLLLALPIVALPAASHAQVICASNNVPPPELPVYEQPPIPVPGYIWTPGYWAGGPSGYFWVPGTWVEPPAVGLLWTPGYWGWRDGIYTWSAGYWGTHVGFYGGVNYGFGYAGTGYEGGHWDNGVFAYNRTVNNFGGVTITNVYEKTVVVDVNAPRVSFNGGSGGITARATAEEEAAAHEQHVAAIPAQMQHERTASGDRSLLASENHGRPAIAATSRPGEFTGKGVVASREAEPKATTVPTKPAALTSNPAETKPIAGHERPVTGQKPLNAETKPLGSEPKPTNAAGKPPLGSEAKPPNQAKLPNEAKPSITAAKPLNGEAKPLSGGPKPPGAEAKLPNTGPTPQVTTPQVAKPQVVKPQVATPPKELNSQPPHVATMPGPAAHPVPAGVPHPKPDSKDKKPPA